MVKYFLKNCTSFLVTAANLQKQSHKAGMDLQIRLQLRPAVFLALFPLWPSVPPASISFPSLRLSTKMICHAGWYASTDKKKTGLNPVLCHSIFGALVRDPFDWQYNLNLSQVCFNLCLLHPWPKHYQRLLPLCLSFWTTPTSIVIQDSLFFKATFVFKYTSTLYWMNPLKSILSIS